jgi:cobalt-zinc-cadmium resistance protein CzcA
VFYAIAIIITAYLPIFTLESVEGRLFKPLAWTVAFALLGALIFSIVVAPVLSSIMFRKGAKEWHNPLMEFLTKRYRSGAAWAIHNRLIVVGFSVVAFAISIYLLASVIGSEFLPHLDEGSLWVLKKAWPSPIRPVFFWPVFRRLPMLSIRLAVLTTAPIGQDFSTPNITSI